MVLFARKTFLLSRPATVRRPPIFEAHRSVTDFVRYFVRSSPLSVDTRRTVPDNTAGDKHRENTSDKPRGPRSDTVFRTARPEPSTSVVEPRTGTVRPPAKPISAGQYLGEITRRYPPKSTADHGILRNARCCRRSTVVRLRLRNNRQRWSVIRRFWTPDRPGSRRRRRRRVESFETDNRSTGREGGTKRIEKTLQKIYEFGKNADHRSEWKFDDNVKIDTMKPANVLNTMLNGKKSRAKDTPWGGHIGSETV